MKNTTDKKFPDLTPRRIPAGVERRILDAVASIRFGTVVVAIQDGRVVQIDSTEKQRIAPDAFPEH
jgi:hypothetical protein